MTRLFNLYSTEDHEVRVSELHPAVGEVRYQFDREHPINSYLPSGSISRTFAEAFSRNFSFAFTSVFRSEMISIDIGEQASKEKEGKGLT